MTELSRTRVPKWPFFAGDACMLGLAWFIHYEAKLPFDHFTIGAIAVCVAIGALLAVWPYLLDYKSSMKDADVDTLKHVAGQLNNLENIAQSITFATSQWQAVQDTSTKTVAAATEIGERMSAEAKAFAESMQRANDTEKSTLRLEAEKLRRSENDWLQVIVVMLDHTYGLHSAAARSGKAAFAEPITQFQNALRDAARRVGLVPFVPTPGEEFDEKRHQSNGASKPEPGATVGETIATGYTFRGQLIRPALVKIAEATTTTSEPEAETKQPPAEPTLL